ncbi:MAG: hypothetical protein E3J77_03960 [Actinobacteria bacterium]|nr:MAG: hypothetical protein E3J77_03960 [Actinomycetota bacterium]
MSKHSKEEKEFSSLEWIAVLCSHIPDQGEQTVRYYGHYSNVTRGRLKIYWLNTLHSSKILTDKNIIMKIKQFLLDI